MLHLLLELNLWQENSTGSARKSFIKAYQLHGPTVDAKTKWYSISGPDTSKTQMGLLNRGQIFPFMGVKSEERSKSNTTPPQEPTQGFSSKPSRMSVSGISVISTRDVCSVQLCYFLAPNENKRRRKESTATTNTYKTKQTEDKVVPTSSLSYVSKSPVSGYTS